jgi:hypothetical protein
MVGVPGGVPAFTPVDPRHGVKDCSRRAGPVFQATATSRPRSISLAEQKRIFDELLGLPEEVVPIGLALVGKPAPDPLADKGTSRKKEMRRPSDDLIHWQRW